MFFLMWTGSKKILSDRDCDVACVNITNNNVININFPDLIKTTLSNSLQPLLRLSFYIVEPDALLVRKDLHRKTDGLWGSTRNLLIKTDIAGSRLFSSREVA